MRHGVCERRSYTFTLWVWDGERQHVGKRHGIRKRNRFHVYNEQRNGNSVHNGQWNKLGKCHCYCNCLRLGIAQHILNSHTRIKLNGCSVFVQRCHCNGVKRWQLHIKWVG